MACAGAMPFRQDFSATTRNLELSKQNMEYDFAYNVSQRRPTATCTLVLWRTVDPELDDRVESVRVQLVLSIVAHLCTHTQCTVQAWRTVALLHIRTRFKEDGMPLGVQCGVRVSR